MMGKVHEKSSFWAGTITLVIVFLFWKALLLAVACVSPGPGYDTSTQLLLPSPSSDEPLVDQILAHVASKLVRWDAVYFISIAERGYLFEQEWAFGWGFTKSIAFAAKGVPTLIVHVQQG